MEKGKEATEVPPESERGLCCTRSAGQQCAQRLEWGFPTSTTWLFGHIRGWQHLFAKNMCLAPKV